MNFNNILIKNTLYVIIVLVYSYYLTLLKFDRPIIPIVEFVISGDDIENQKGQIYCHTGNSYRGSYRIDFRYTKENRVGNNRYKIRAELPCPNNVTNLRLDPLPNKGSVALQSFRVHSNVWQEINLLDLFENIKPLSNIKKLEYEDNEILMTFNGKDPYLEITDQMQEYLIPVANHYIFTFFKYFINTFLFLKLVIFMGYHILNKGPVMVKNISFIKSKTDSLIENIYTFIVSLFKKQANINTVLVSTCFLLFLIANLLFFNHLFPQFKNDNLAILLIIILSFFIPLILYVILLVISPKNLFFKALAGFLFLLFSIGFIADVSLFSLNGMHISHGLGMLFNGGIGNFGKNLAFTKLSWTELYFYLGTMIVGLIFCWIFTLVCEVKLKKYHIKVSTLKMLVLSIILLGVTFLLQKVTYRNLSPGKIDVLETNHLLYLPMANHNNFILEYNIITKPFKRSDILNEDETIYLATSPVKNIFIFIFESLREDIVNKETMPFLNAFKQEAWQFSRSISSGNATHYGWYSIINSSNPYYWERYNNLKDKRGSTMLQIFKHAGFEINVYTAKDLSYLKSDKVLFGENINLPDYISDHPKLSPPEHDKRVITQLINDLDKFQNNKSLNLVFLDSSHYPYRWLDGEIDELKPYIGTSNKGVNLTKAKLITKKDKKQIFNRYRNSNMFSDMLFGKFVEEFNQSSLSEKSIVVAVGDHGQQFLEHGYLLHGFTLNSEDIHVPLYFQGVNIEPKKDQQTATHLDIMPTLLELSGIKPVVNSFDGISLVEGKQDYGLSAAAGMQNTPYSFILENTYYKLTFRIEKNNPINSKKLFVDQIFTQGDEIYIPGQGEKKDYIEFIKREFPGFPKKLTFINKSKIN